jgi:hypothetical protein
VTPFDPHSVARARDAGTRSLRRYTVTASVAAVALAGAVTAIAASTPTKHAGGSGTTSQPPAVTQQQPSQSQGQDDWSQFFGDDQGNGQDQQQVPQQQVPQSPQPSYGSPSSGTS